MAFPRRSSAGFDSIAMLAGPIAVLAAIAAMLTPSAAEGSFPGANGVIAYSAEHSIWVVDPATGDQLRLTTGPEDSAPSFSPSGDLLAFQRRTTTTVTAPQRPPTGPATSSQRRPVSTVTVDIANADGSDPAPLVAASPVPLLHLTTSTVTVYVAYADGSNPTPLVAGSEPAFSPNGTQIVFVRPSGLFLTGVAPGSPVRPLTDHPGDRTPRWSSKGSIVFQRADGTGTELDIVTPPSTHIRRLFTYQRGDEDQAVMWPEWSPNGRSISVALCERGSEIPTVETVPSIVFHSSCAPDVWAPAGGPPLEAGTGALRGKPDSSCPPFIESGANEDVSFIGPHGPLYQDEGPNWPIAWQPLHAGTLRVLTMPCTEDKERENAPIAATSPAILMHGGQLCVYFRRRHRKICHKT
jgi:hypothetical protein